MLTYDTLVEQGKQRGMPPTKMRGILREYLQMLILKELSKSENGRNLYFTGGTYLRLVHNLKRFSEDLDFNTSILKEKEFEKLINEIKIELKRINIDSNIRFKHWDNIYAAHILFPEIEKTYDIMSRYSKKEGIIIKIETNRPKWKIKKETHIISGFGEFYPCVCTDKSSLFADKIDALTKKTRGRHIYDIIFMLSNKFPIDKTVLSFLGLHKDPLDIILDRIKSFPKIELKKMADALRPFLFEENEADLIVNAHEIFPILLKKYSQH